MRGFTAVEILLVTSLLGILALAVVFLLPPVAAVTLEAAAHQVRSDIEFAQQNAMITGQTSGVQFVSAGSYTVYQGTTATPLMSPLTGQSMVMTLSASYVGTAISGNYTVEFDSMGKPSTGGGGSVNLSNGGVTRTIAVTANTGRVTIQ